jgi:hypothetical protein
LRSSAETPLAGSRGALDRASEPAWVLVASVVEPPHPTADESAQAIAVIDARFRERGRIDFALFHESYLG